MKSLIVANWKMNPQTLEGAKLLFNSVKKGIKNIKNVEVVICPPFPYLLEFLSKWRKIQVKTGAQDCFWEKSWAFTGEISPAMLKNLGCQYVIIGHSERRRYFNETDEMINKKIKAALRSGLKPILCVGEKEKERKEGKTFEILKNQLRKDLKNIEPGTKNLVWGVIENLILAYEPVWAIGTGKACRVLEAKEVLEFLKKRFPRNQILYGGSVNSKNARDFIKKANFDGLLIGGVSLDAKEFIDVIKNICYI